MKKVQWLGMVILVAGFITAGCGKKPEAEVLDPVKYGIGKDAKICPVSKDLIGSMGKGLELALSNGKKIMVCCPACKKPIEKDLKKYEPLMY